MRLTDTQSQEALILLGMARDFENMTVRSAADRRDWHRRVDRMLELFPTHDKTSARYDTPARREHREMVANLYREPRPGGQGTLRLKTREK